MKKLKLEVGKKFGDWTIISEHTIVENNLTQWGCQCKCGVVSLVPLNNLMNGSSTKCKNCAALEIGKKKRKGAGDISGNMWSQFLASCTRKGIEVNIRVEQAWDLFEDQHGKCAISGVDIVLTGYPYDREKTTAELITNDDSNGYNFNNSIWVHKDISCMMKKISYDKFMYYIDKIAHKQNYEFTE